jgi:hypothetical protein
VKPLSLRGRFPFSLQPLRALLGGLCFICVTLVHASDLKTQWSYRNAEDFERISEFFTGKENPGNRVIVRSTPENRQGMYFSVMIKDGVNSLPAGSKAVIEVLHALSPETQTYTFPVPNSPKNHQELLMGITGDNWPAAKYKPMAWRIRLMNAEGEVLSSDKSYLWR